MVCISRGPYSGPSPPPCPPPTPHGTPSGAVAACPPSPAAAGGLGGRSGLSRPLGSPPGCGVRGGGAALTPLPRSAAAATASAVVAATASAARRTRSSALWLNASCRVRKITCAGAASTEPQLASSPALPAAVQHYPAVPLMRAAAGQTACMPRSGLPRPAPLVAFLTALQKRTSKYALEGRTCGWS
jgi:hypothetical protein